MKLRQTDTETGHVYTDDSTGKSYIGVTTVFKLVEAPPLEVWALRIGERAAKRIGTKAAAYGHGLHSVWERIGKGELVTEASIDKLVKPRFRAEGKKLLQWADENVEEFLYSEASILDDNLLVAGMLDTICTLKGKEGKAVLDLKTGRIKPMARMQMEVYRRGAANTLSIPLEELNERVILSCNAKKKNAQAYYLGLDNSDYMAYTNLIGYYRWINSDSGKMDLKELKKNGKVRK